MTHALPPLPFDVASLEPHVDARTMQLHHGKHHASYVAKLNAALEEFPELQSRSALWLLCNSGQVPESIRTTVRNNAGGHIKHSLFWRAMAPACGSVPSGPLARAIIESFGSLEQFKTQFAAAGGRVFGSGWVWLVRAQHADAGLRILTTPGHDHPLMEGCSPLLHKLVTFTGFSLTGADAAPALLGQARGDDAARQPHFLWLHQYPGEVLRERGAAGICRNVRRRLRVAGDPAGRQSFRLV